MSGPTKGGPNIHPGGDTSTSRKSPWVLLLACVGGPLTIGLFLLGTTGEDDRLITAALGLMAVILLTAGASFMSRSKVAKARRRRVWETGTPGVAIINRIGTKGGEFNDHPYVDLYLQVTLDGQTESYEGHTLSLISKLAIPRIQPGCEIAVRVDADDPEFIVVDAELTPYGYG